MGIRCTHEKAMSIQGKRVIMQDSAGDPTILDTVDLEPSLLCLNLAVLMGAVSPDALDGCQPGDILMHVPGMERWPLFPYMTSDGRVMHGVHLTEEQMRVKVRELRRTNASLQFLRGGLRMCRRSLANAILAHQMTNIAGVHAAADVASAAGGWAAGVAGTSNTMRLTYASQATENLHSHMADVTNGRTVHPRMLAVRHAVASGVSQTEQAETAAPGAGMAAVGAHDLTGESVVSGVAIVSIIQAVLSHPLLVHATWHLQCALANVRELVRADVTLMPNSRFSPLPRPWLLWSPDGCSHQSWPVSSSVCQCTSWVWRRGTGKRWRNTLVMCRLLCTSWRGPILYIVLCTTVQCTWPVLLLARRLSPLQA